jgi:thymidylate synthase (FAD)
MASINEYSTRYSEAIDSAQTALSEWRLQSLVNKQGSGGLVDAWPEGYYVVNDLSTGGWVVMHDDEYVMTRWGIASFDDEPTPADYLDRLELVMQTDNRDLYEERLKFGVAREQARKDLPLSTYTEAYWKIDLDNLLHCLRLRRDSHAQQEIRTFGNAMYELIYAIVALSVRGLLPRRLAAWG